MPQCAVERRATALIARRRDRDRAMSRPRRATRRSFAHPNCDVDATVESSFAFASRVEVTVPVADDDDDDDVARALDDAARDVDASVRYEAMMSVADALEPRFVHEHVRRWRRGTRGDDDGDAAAARRDGGDGDARFGLVTAETRADSDDCWCVTPSGRFVGSLMSETRERLGLQSVEDERGKATVSVNLKRDEFRVSNWFHDRVGECARTLEAEVGKVKVFCGYMVNGAHEEVKFPQGVTESRRVANEKSSERLVASAEIHRELVRASAWGDDEWKTFMDSSGECRDRLEDVLEFCGRLSMGSGYGLRDGGETTSMETRRWRGFLLYPDIKRVIEAARKVTRDGNAPYAIVTVWSFANAPRNLAGAPSKKVEHDACVPRGSDVLTLIVFPDGGYLKYAV